MIKHRSGETQQAEERLRQMGGGARASISSSLKIPLDNSNPEGEHEPRLLTSRDRNSAARWGRQRKEHLITICRGIEARTQIRGGISFRQILHTGSEPSQLIGDREACIVGHKGAGTALEKGGASPQQVQE